MSALRKVVVLVLALTLPVYASAAVGAFTLCLLPTSGHASGHHITAAANGHPCCPAAKAPVSSAKSQTNSQHPLGHDGSACCHAYQLPVELQGALLALPVVPALVASVVTTPTFSHDPNGLWRPPRSL